ncbi:hypothetical protein Droror1_Dr00026822, partial [Drosera rotundifolia]
MRQSFVQPWVAVSVQVFEPSDEILIVAQIKWSEYLVGYFINGNLGFKMVEVATRGFWGKMGLEEVL